jgi:DNA-binding GntR family transcriptional regulator
MNGQDHQLFSLSQSAKEHDIPIKTDIIELAIRLPVSNEELFVYGVERRAQSALGLDANSRFISIQRVRLLRDTKSQKDIPNVIQRVYLNPARFPENFLEDHKFETESLSSIYQGYRYEVDVRDTTLTARLLHPDERQVLMSKFKWHPTPTAVLDAEQQTYARDKAGRTVLLEYLKATYMEGWEYKIKNRGT